MVFSEVPALKEIKSLHGLFSINAYEDKEERVKFRFECWWSEFWLIWLEEYGTIRKILTFPIFLVWILTMLLERIW